MEPTPFVGRAEEFERLERALRRAQSGVGSTVLVAGEAGIGKSRLASELTTRARAAGFEVLVGRCIDLIGTELPYQPFAEALRPGLLVTARARCPGFRRSGRQARSCVCSRRRSRCFSGLAAAAPVLLVLEDLHWADTSTLDLVVFLAHNLAERRLLLLATYRADELSSAERVRRLADGVRRSGSALVLELGPLEREELRALLTARRGAPPPQSVADAIVARSEGNPFFAEELLAAAGDAEQLSFRAACATCFCSAWRGSTAGRRACCKLAAAAGREVGLPAAARRGRAGRARRARVSARGPSITACSSPIRRQAAFASATRCSPRRSTKRCCPASARSCTRGSPPSSRAAKRLRRRRSSHRIGKRRGEPLRRSSRRSRPRARRRRSSAWRRLWRTSSGRSRLWAAVPDATAVAGLDLAELSSWAAQRALQTDAAPRAVELGRRAVALVGDADPVRAGTPARAPRQLPVRSRQPRRRPRCARARRRARAGAAALGGPRTGAGGARACIDAGLAPRSVSIDLRAGARSRPRGRRTLGRIPGGGGPRSRPCLPRPRRRRARAPSLGPAARGTGRRPEELVFAYCWLTDVLTMLGRPRESTRVAAAAVSVVRRYGVAHGTIISNQVEALVATGEWDEADRLGAAALRPSTANWPHFRRLNRAALAVGRGDFDDARVHLEAALRHRARGRARFAGLRPRSSPSSPSGSAAGRTPRRPCATGSRARARATPR